MRAAEGLFGSRSADGDCGASRHDTQNVRTAPYPPSYLYLDNVPTPGASLCDVMCDQVGILLHLVETFNGVCIIITNLKERIDPAFHRRMKARHTPLLPQIINTQILLHT
jgi:hypothetical protein